MRSSFSKPQRDLLHAVFQRAPERLPRINVMRICCELFVGIGLIAFSSSVATAATEIKLSGSKTSTQYVPAEGFGVHGTFTVNVSATIHDGRIFADDNRSTLQVDVETVAGDNGALDFSGTVTITDSSGKAHALKLVSPWFKTIGTGSPRRVFRYVDKGTSIDVGKLQEMKAKISIHPVVKTYKGVVALGAEDSTLVLKPEK